jgi:thiamine-phosphate pyrophosphorylase
MDHRLVAWARAVKARRRGAGPPPLWLFTEPARMPDLSRAVAALPAGLCGVVFRHDHVPGRAILLREVARLCRGRRLALVVAGDSTFLPPGAGRHLRGGRGRRSPSRLTTSSAHGRAVLIRAGRAGADLVFLSPAFATGSHPGARPLGPARWSAMARGVLLPVLALGGVSGRNVRRLPRWAAGAGAIGALTA